MAADPDSRDPTISGSRTAEREALVLDQRLRKLGNQRDALLDGEQGSSSSCDDIHGVAGYGSAELLPTLHVQQPDETGAGQGDIMPRVAAAQLGGVLRLLFEETLRRTLDGHSNEEIADAVSQDAIVAFGTLEPSLANYAMRR